MVSKNRNERIPLWNHMFPRIVFVPSARTSAEYLCFSSAYSTPVTPSPSFTQCPIEARALLLILPP